MVPPPPLVYLVEVIAVISLIPSLVPWESFQNCTQLLANQHEGTISHDPRSRAVPVVTLGKRSFAYLRKVVVGRGEIPETCLQSTAIKCQRSWDRGPINIIVLLHLITSSPAIVVTCGVVIPLLIAVASRRN